MLQLDRSRLLAGVVLYGIVAILIHRLLDGTIIYYVNQRYAWLIWVAVAGIGLMALALEVSAWRRSRCDAPSRSATRVGWSSLAVLALPVVLGLAPEYLLGSAALVNRQVAVGSLPPDAGRRAPRGTILMPGERSMLDWMVEFHIADDPHRFDGQEARMTGFVYRDDRLGPDQIQLSRFLMSCCVADATALGIVVQAPELSFVGDDQWLTVSGRFAVGEIGAESVLILIAEKVEPIEVPLSPYLYY